MGCTNVAVLFGKVDFDRRWPKSLDVEEGLGRKEMASCTLPLIYAWAITIHKAQGVTLDAAIMDIGKNIFEYGQTYVALSRVKTLEGLYLTSFDYTKIAANPKVKKFYGDD